MWDSAAVIKEKIIIREKGYKLFMYTFLENCNMYIQIHALANFKFWVTNFWICSPILGMNKACPL